MWKSNPDNILNLNGNDGLPSSLPGINIKLNCKK
jgi:hypothetical protein